jgi:NADH:ubiquinone oxidoreductase subunit F (NADH-binding)
MTITEPPRAGGQLGAVTRLSVGWREPEQPTLLRTHANRYGPMPSPARAASLTAAVTSAGLTGRGGAGFPTGVKMQAVAVQRRPAVVVANGMDSEPASEKDEALLARAPHLVIEGAVLVALAIGAGQVHLAVSGARSWLIGALRRALAERSRAGLDPVGIELHGLPGGYVTSSETAIVQWLNGGPAKPTAVPPRPFQRGVGRLPTLISNVETFAHVALIARFGPAWFRQAGLPQAPGSMLVTISGAVRAPGVHEIETGTTIGAALALGGADGRSRSVLIGGYFGSWADLKEAAPLPLAAGPLRQVGAAPGAGVLFALPEGACGVSETARVLGWLAAQSAQQCGPCMFGLPAIAGDFAQLARSRPDPMVFDRLNRRLGTVAGRGACSHPDGAVRLARSALSVFAADVRAHAAGRPCLHTRSHEPQRPVLPIPVRQGTDGWS